MKAVVIDNQEIYRAGLKHSLSQLDSYKFKLVVELDFSEGIKFLENENNVDFIAFDTAILNLESSTRFANALALHSNCLIVALSDKCRDDNTIRLFDLGVNALLPKSSDIEGFNQLFRLVTSHGFCLPQTHKFVQPCGFDRRRSSTPYQPAEATLLTNRQKEILKIVAEGKSDKEISRILGISEGTVRTHLKNIYKTLKATNRTEAAFIAFQQM